MSAEAGLEFVDSSVLLYAYDRSAGARHDRARAMVARLGSARRGALSVQVLQEFYVNATRKIERRLSHDAAAARLRALSRWPVHVPGSNHVLAAAELAFTVRLSFWDAMILISAQAMGASTVWSEDLTDGQLVGNVTIRNPFT